MTLQELTVAVLEGRIEKRDTPTRCLRVSAIYQEPIIRPFLTNLLGPHDYVTDDTLSEGQIELSELPHA